MFIVKLFLTTNLSLALPFQGGLGSQFLSPNGVTEECYILNKIPKGDYSKKDLETESLYCQFDFYNDKIALCPKTWNSSPATIILDISQSHFTNSQYEASKYCGQLERPDDVKRFAKFKTSMNQEDTSGTFSQSPLLYYHFSRYFKTKVDVPVAVYREMDKNIHLERITDRGLKKAEEGLNKAGWTHLFNVEKSLDAADYTPLHDIFTEELDKVYGTLVDDKGGSYRNELNGTRTSSWGLGHNLEMQRTAPFIALRTKKPLLEAIAYSVEEANKDPKMAIDLIQVKPLQMIYWMRELIEINLLDYIFNQQDRNENIDFEWVWYYVKNNKVDKKTEKRDEFKKIPREFMSDVTVPIDLIDFNPTLIQRSAINDNDAGVRVQYSNFTKESQMTENLFHYSAKLFKKLMSLQKDFEQKGEIYQWLKKRFSLDSAQFELIITNTKELSLSLKKQCQNITFDLDEPDEFLIEGVVVKKINCDDY